MNKGRRAHALGLLLSKSLEVIPPHSFTAKILWYVYNDALNQSRIVESYVVSSILAKDNECSNENSCANFFAHLCRLCGKFLEEFQVIELCTL